MGASSLCWYQGSGSLQSSGEGEKSNLGPLFVVAITVDLKKYICTTVRAVSKVLFGAK